MEGLWGDRSNIEGLEDRYQLWEITFQLICEHGLGGETDAKD